jgi:hypothetical protein
VSAPEKHPCSAGFSSEDELQRGVYARCKQVRWRWQALLPTTLCTGLPCCVTCHLSPVPSKPRLALMRLLHVPHFPCCSCSRTEAAVWTRMQVCPAWLVDCGGSCHMPGAPCSTKPEQLCPVVPLTGALCTMHLLQLQQCGMQPVQRAAKLWLYTGQTASPHSPWWAGWSGRCSWLYNTAVLSLLPYSM